MNYYYYECPIGTLTIIASNDRLQKIVLEKIQCDHVLFCNEIILTTMSQLDEYFSKERYVFDIPYDLHGTDFQLSVWTELCNIDYGKTKSYSDVAVSIDAPKAVRAIGNANNRNPLPIIIPCHRVIGKNHKMVGYAGGLEKKKFLLELEGYHIELF